MTASVLTHQPVGWWTSDQAASFLNVSTATVLRLAKASDLPHRMVGRQYRFVPAELADWTGSSKPAAGRRQPAGWFADELAKLDPYAAA